ncbi:MAG: M99 family carboxypeptidase catalytic domain-containing protein, partial [Campylobacterota bacterium]|nr:M99 family carboxypeptidase catalytic domain-containing protein [Campylobacterota bacterium]
MNLGMLKLYKFLVLIFLSTPIFCAASSLDFDLIKKGSQDDNTLLIVGGIQGDEPGGFIAASLIATHYTITKGSVWVVPNLNFYSIIRKSRAPNGDMNRKFAALSTDDPEYEIVQRIKGYIKAPEVKKILNLHDGSGYYRERYIDAYHNPRRWGQCSVIDQEELNHLEAYPNLHEIALQVVNHLNQNLLRKEDVFGIKNTKTRFEKTFEQTEMAKTLTYYAITNGKSAFGHETSKSLAVKDRVYYKLLALEEHMNIMGIEFERPFEMSPKSIQNIIDNDIYITFYDDKIKLPL